MPDIWDYFGKLHNTLATSAWPSFQQRILLQNSNVRFQGKELIFIVTDVYITGQN